MINTRLEKKPRQMFLHSLCFVLRPVTSALDIYINRCICIRPSLEVRMYI